jgi:hypothetical protein
MFIKIIYRKGFRGGSPLRGNVGANLRVRPLKIYKTGNYFVSIPKQLQQRPEGLETFFTLLMNDILIEVADGENLGYFVKPYFVICY